MNLTLPIALLASASFVAAQVPCFDSAPGTALTLGDDAFSGPLALGFTFNFNGVAHTTVDVCSNGFIVFGTATGFPDYTPTVGELLTGTDARVCPNWRDLNPTQGGTVSYNAVPASGPNPAYFSVTWTDVPQYFNTGANSFQCIFIDGDQMQMSFDANCANASNTWVVGCSEGGAAVANPIAYAAMPILTAGNPTLHENGAGGHPLAAQTVQFIPDGNNGWIVAPLTGCASVESYGTGCIHRFQSAYENFAASSTFDLSNTALMGIFTGGGYVLAQSTAAFTPPSGTAVNLGLGDDTSAVITPSASFPYPGGSTPTLEVCSNGFVSVGGNGTAYTPNLANWLGFAYPCWSTWHDYTPNAINNVWWEEINGVVIVTWDNVISYNTTNPNTFQFHFELATGFWHIVWQTMDTVAGNGYLVGYTPGNGAADPGNADLSPVVAGTSTIQTFATDNLPIRLDTDAAPVVGTTINLTTSNVSPTAAFGAVLLGLQRFDPGLSLAGIGMDGCLQHNELLASLGLNILSGQPSFVQPFTVPAIASGVNFQAQSAVYDPAGGLTVLGGLSSNGLQLSAGN